MQASLLHFVIRREGPCIPREQVHNANADSWKKGGPLSPRCAEPCIARSPCRLFQRHHIAGTLWHPGETPCTDLGAAHSWKIWIWLFCNGGLSRMVVSPGAVWLSMDWLPNLDHTKVFLVLHSQDWRVWKNFRCCYVWFPPWKSILCSESCRY